LEPVAAVLAYDARPEAEIKDKNIVVADLGGTRSDIAVIASRGGMYSVLATSHDYDFTGLKLDEVLIDYFAKEFMKKNKKDPREDARGLAKLKLESESTKKALSIGANATISIESLVDGTDFTSNINRTRYELLSSKIFGGISREIEGVVKKAELDVLDIDEIILSGGTSHTPKIASNLVALFPPTTKVIAPSTVSTAINPADLNARGAAMQASLIEDFDLEDITQSAHPMVTVTPHLKNAIGVLVLSGDSDRGIFTPLLAADTALPARRSANFATPKEGGDVLVKICEGVRDIKVTKPEPKSKAPKTETKDDSDDDEDDSSDEEEETREKVWKASTVLAEAAVKGVKKGGKVEVMVNVGGDLGVTITAREVGGKGVRGTLEKGSTNGSA
jgi:molecular chaperone DnaK (HSP70)